MRAAPIFLSAAILVLGVALTRVRVVEAGGCADEWKDVVECTNQVKVPTNIEQDSVCDFADRYFGCWTKSCCELAGVDNAVEAVVDSFKDYNCATKCGSGSSLAASRLLWLLLGVVFAALVI